MKLNALWGLALAVMCAACSSNTSPASPPVDAPAEVSVVFDRGPCPRDGEPCECGVGAGVVRCRGALAVCECPGVSLDSGAVVDAGAVVEVAAPIDMSVPVEASVPVDAGRDGCASSTVGNCCGVACMVPPHASAAACVAGRCAVGMCTAGYGDCDSDVANGCEVELTTSRAHCGACGAPCATGRGCVASACVLCDADGDGVTIAACGGTDCDDTDRTIRPGATERCDGLDDDCDGVGDTNGPALDAWCAGVTRWARDGGVPTCVAAGSAMNRPMGYARFTRVCRLCTVVAGTRSCGCFVDDYAIWVC